jgi:hypothetical protein
MKPRLAETLLMISFSVKYLWEGLDHDFKAFERKRWTSNHNSTFELHFTSMMQLIERMNES